MSYFKKNKTNVWLWSGILLGVALDAALKELTFSRILHGSRIQPVMNPGASWSLALPVEGLIVISFLAIGAFIRLHRTEKIGHLATVLLLAGSVGNLYDRLTFLAVRDRISLPWFPVFNLADVFLTIGVLLVAFDYKQKSRVK